MKIKDALEKKSMDINDYAREVERRNTVPYWLSEIANILKGQRNTKGEDEIDDNTSLNPDLARDLRELLIIAHRVTDETDRRKLADIAEKWLRKLPIEN